MPNEYTCNHCRLEFTVGWFHYHFFDSGFAAETNLVCSACGTCHTVKHAIADSKPDELLARSGPLIGGSLVFHNWVPCATAINLRPGREKTHLGLTGMRDTLKPGGSSMWFLSSGRNTLG